MTRRSDWDHFPKVIEYFIMVAIVLVIALIIVEELAIIYHWEHRWIEYLLITAFCFDLLFSVEFAGRGIISARHGHFWYYIRAQRGWVDFLTSIPLLLLVSGPAVLLIVLGDAGEGAFMTYLTILKTAKAIRVTRILRLVRVIKLFGKIQNTESMMTNRQVGIISTMMVVSLIVALMVSQFISVIHVGDRFQYQKWKLDALTAVFSELKNADGAAATAGAPTEAWALKLVKESPAYKDLIRLKDPRGEIIYLNDNYRELDFTSFHKFFPLGDSGYEVEISYHRADAEHSKLNLFVLFAVLVLVGALMLLYTPIFAKQIADPIFIMDKGLRQWDYNLEVMVDKDHSHEEISELARVYNERWLTIKNQIRSYRKDRHADQEKSSLSMDDIL
jgi:hypothetical protein